LGVCFKEADHMQHNLYFSKIQTLSGQFEKGGASANQHAHHDKKTFQDEYRSFLKKYNVEYDERYVWD
jgi:hypothetical protein